MDNFQTTAEEVLKSKEPYFNHMDTNVSCKIVVYY